MVQVIAASAECSFSALKRIKSYLCNTMTQESWNHCMLQQHMHHEKTDEPDLVHVEKEFVSVCEGRNLEIIVLRLIYGYVLLVITYIILYWICTIHKVSTLSPPSPLPAPNLTWAYCHQETVLYQSVLLKPSVKKPVINNSYYYFV